MRFALANAMHSALAIAFACALLMTGPIEAAAKMSDPVHGTYETTAPLLQPDDARAGMCDGFDGLAFTFCVALCEASACDQIDDDTCVLLHHGFARATGGLAAPCESDASPAQLL